MGDQRSGTAKITWSNGQVPVSDQFDDPYYSLENGLAESEHVFLAGNGLPDRLRPGFNVAELGFGTGLNLLAFCRLVAGMAMPLRFTTFEAFPMAPDDMARALEAFPEVQALAEPMLDARRSGLDRWTMGDVEVQLIEGDARETLHAWNGRADAWFLDGFSPAKNPELWGEALLAQVGAHTAPGGTCATYTAAGFVRRELEDAGFEVSRQPGFGRKRHMTVGRLD
ncbi:MAG: tRNA (5-methylaminomethyl-2-thiouridine)(34)-methyltransferase MnmD [Pseudomonadota bacterium]